MFTIKFRTKQIGKNIIIIFCLVLTCKSPGNKNTHVAEDALAIENETAERIQQMKEKASSIFTNERGFREAELEGAITMIYIPGGNFYMGTDIGLSIEQPMHEVYLDGYWIGKYPVTAGQFREFVEATGYVTDAEKGMGSWQWTGKIPEEGDDWDPWKPMPDGAWNNIYFEQEDNHPVLQNT